MNRSRNVLILKMMKKSASVQAYFNKGIMMIREMKFKTKENTFRSINLVLIQIHSDKRLFILTYNNKKKKKKKLSH